MACARGRRAQKRAGSPFPGLHPACESQSHQWTLRFAVDLPATLVGRPGQRATHRRPNRVRIAAEFAGRSAHAQRTAVAFMHPHVGAVPIEARELVGSFTEACVVCAGHADVVLEPLKAAGAADEAFWNVRQLLHTLRPFDMGRAPAVRGYRLCLSRESRSRAHSGVAPRWWSPKRHSHVPGTKCGAPDMIVGHSTPGSGGHRPPSLSLASAISGRCEWKPKASRVSNFSFVFIASRRPFESWLRSAEQMPS